MMTTQMYTKYVRGFTRLEAELKAEEYERENEGCFITVYPAEQVGFLETCINGGQPWCVKVEIHVEV